MRIQAPENVSDVVHGVPGCGRRQAVRNIRTKVRAFTAMEHDFTKTPEIDVESAACTMHRDGT
jgi:hypothetical protein